MSLLGLESIEEIFAAGEESTVLAEDVVDMLDPKGPAPRVGETVAEYSARTGIMSPGAEGTAGAPPFVITEESITAEEAAARADAQYAAEARRALAEMTERYKKTNAQRSWDKYFRSQGKPLTDEPYAQPVPAERVGDISGKAGVYRPPRSRSPLENYKDFIRGRPNRVPPQKLTEHLLQNDKKGRSDRSSAVSGERVLPVGSSVDMDGGSSSSSLRRRLPYASIFRGGNGTRLTGRKRGRSEARTTAKEYVRRIMSGYSRADYDSLLTSFSRYANAGLPYQGYNPTTLLAAARRLWRQRRGVGMRPYGRPWPKGGFHWRPMKPFSMRQRWRYI